MHLHMWSLKADFKVNIFLSPNLSKWISVINLTILLQVQIVLCSKGQSTFEHIYSIGGTAILNTLIHI